MGDLRPSVLLSAALERFCPTRSIYVGISRLDRVLVSPAMAADATWSFYLHPPSTGHASLEASFTTCLLPWLQNGTLPLRLVISDVQ